MIGYHHVLMIIIAVAIILLCKLPRHSPGIEVPHLAWNVPNSLQPYCWPDALHHRQKSPTSS